MATSTSHGVEQRLLEQVIDLTRRFEDSWISVDGTLDGLVSPDGSLEALVAAIQPNGPTPTTDGCEVVSPYMKDAQEFHEPPYSVVDITSPRYPSRLRSIADRPLLLYVKGRLPETHAKSVAIVGSRNASNQGLDAAFEVAGAVAELGHPVISGLAKGIDTAAHEGALSRGGITVAVMGNGIDLVYPRENALLAERIAGSGAVVSQFAPGQQPSKTTFPARNATIAGLADVSILIELAEQSGTRIEADRTLQQGKPVWLWGPIMRGHEWAVRFASHPDVSFIDSVDEVIDALAG